MTEKNVLINDAVVDGVIFEGRKKLITIVSQDNGVKL